jgi:hypothetical protein
MKVEVFVALMTRTRIPTWKAPVFVIPVNTCDPVANVLVDVDAVEE